MQMDYITLNNYIRSHFGKKLYKLAINGGFTCPNRDGTLDTRGCIFCSGAGSGEFSESACLSVTEQIEHGKKRVAAKLPKNEAAGYIAYFQAFTNTYGPVSKLRSLFSEAISHPEVEVLSIATRPDCLPEEVLELLSELNKIKPVWVELGLQTIHEKTASYIRRGYELSVYDRAVEELKNRGLSVIVHVILGLPGETREDMLSTVRYVNTSGADGIKLQLLHVIENTDLAADYKAGKFECLSLDEYASLIRDCIQVIGTKLVIHRMTGDGDKKTLIAPEWSMDKKNVLNTINRALSKT